ncbi:MAG: response regulator [Anaerolineae bacterium]|nr:response regulator [Anaerolineae bacterium]
MSNEAYILLVDDDEEVLGTLSRALNREGYTVRHTTSGQTGIQMIRQDQPSLLVLDIIMPGMDGLEVCKTLRSDETFHRLPILFLSARGHTDEVVEGLDAGGDDYLIKPFELTELHARIRALLRAPSATRRECGPFHWRTDAGFQHAPARNRW